MSTLIVQELNTTLTQTIFVEQRIRIDSLRPKVYLHNDPAGTFTFSVKEGSTILGSASLDIATIKTNAVFANNQYHYGFIRWQFADNLVLNRGTYTIELTSSGYTFSPSSYFGWIREYEALTNNITEGQVANLDIENPLSVQIWSYE